MQLRFHMIYNLHQYFCNLHHKLSTIQKKQRKQENKKNIFNKNERRCRDVKTQNVREQGREVNVEPKFKQTNSI